MAIAPVFYRERMGQVLALTAVAAGYAAVAFALWQLGRRARRRGVGADVIAVFDEIWHPAAYRPRPEIQRQQQRRDTDRVPSGPSWHGRVRLARPASTPGERR